MYYTHVNFSNRRNCAGGERIYMEVLSTLCVFSVNLNFPKDYSLLKTSIWIKSNKYTRKIIYKISHELISILIWAKEYESIKVSDFKPKDTYAHTHTHTHTHTHNLTKRMKHDNQQETYKISGGMHSYSFLSAVAWAEWQILFRK